MYILLKSNLLIGVFIMHQPVLVFTKSATVLDAHNALEPYSSNLKVEFVDKTDELLHEYKDHKERAIYDFYAKSFEDFVKEYFSHYEVIEVDGKTCYGYWENPQSIYDGSVVGGRFKEWLVLKEQANNDETQFTYFNQVGNIDWDKTFENIASLHDKHHELITPSYIDDNGEAHIFPSMYLPFPFMPDSIQDAKEFREKFLDYVKNNPNLNVTMIDCHI